MKRRNVLTNIALGVGGFAVGKKKIINSEMIGGSIEKNIELLTPFISKGNVNHSVCRWCYGKIPMAEFIEGVTGIDGMKSIELTTPEQWPDLKKNGLTSAIGTGPFANIQKGFNDPQYHGKLQKSYLELIDQAADNGIPTVIVFSGNRNGMDDKVGMENCAVGLEPLVKRAEKRGVTIIMELLNSKVNHKDYMCDKTPWGAELVEKMGSDRLKLLYDIYHMQIMEGDVIATINKYQDHIAHYHTGGVPGRNEIDETQELNYPAIMKAIVDTGYKGFVGQEFIPTWEDPIAALRHGVETCDV